jgi:hypothetical protein
MQPAAFPRPPKTVRCRRFRSSLSPSSATSCLSQSRDPPARCRQVAIWPNPGLLNKLREKQHRRVASRWWDAMYWTERLRWGENQMAPVVRVQCRYRPGVPGIVCMAVVGRAASARRRRELVWWVCVGGGRLLFPVHSIHEARVGVVLGVGVCAPVTLYSSVNRGAHQPS